MEEADYITKRRLDIWANYHQGFESLEKTGKVRRPVAPQDCVHNAHMYYLLLPNLAQRSKFIEQIKSKGVQTVFHYIPLHSSPLGNNIGRAVGDMKHTNSVGDQLVRLPLWLGLEERLSEVIEAAQTLIN